MKQYLKLLETIIETGVTKEGARAGMPATKGVFGYQMRFNLSEGFPLLTTKKMPFKAIAHELIWFLRGHTNIKYLVDNKVHIWDGDAYRHYLNKCKEYNIAPCGKEGFIASIETGDMDNWFEINCPTYKLGDLGEVYGAQWRNWDNKGVDQIKKVIEAIKKNPFGRRHIVSAWNPAEVDNMALPPCHLLFQFNCRPLTYKERTTLCEKMGIIPYLISEEKLTEKGVPKFYLDCAMTQRSTDSFLGAPFNIASYSLLTEVIAKMCGMLAGEFVWSTNDTHIYDNHIEAVKEQLTREPMPLCTLKISERVASFLDISELNIDDLSIENYNSHPSIKGELSVGV